MYFSRNPLLYTLSLSLFTWLTLAVTYNSSTPSPEATSAIIAIKNLISLKNLATANKEYSILPQIATEDVVFQITNASSPEFNVNITGLANVTNYIIDTDGSNIVVRESSSQFVELLNHTHARALSNTQGTYYGQGDLTGQVLVFNQRIEDFLRVEDGLWKFYSTTLTVVVSYIFFFILLSVV